MCVSRGLTYINVHYENFLVQRGVRATLELRLLLKTMGYL